jgi:phage terminase large subunit-like protein
LVPLRSRHPLPLSFSEGTSSLLIPLLPQPGRGAAIMTTCSPPYQWWTCDFDGQHYSGCCRVDACHQTPAGCPSDDQQPPSTTSAGGITFTAATLTSRAFTVTPLLTFFTAAGTFIQATSAQTSDSGLVSQTTSSLAAAATSDGGTSSGIQIPLEGLVGLVVGCSLLAVLGAILACLHWRRPRDKNKKGNGVESPPRPVIGLPIPGSFRVVDSAEGKHTVW